MKILALLCAVSLFIASTASAGILKLTESSFSANAGQITFSEFSIGTVNPVYNPLDYGGVLTDPTISFGGFFAGQSLSGNPTVDCPGAAATACIVGDPSASLSLDPNSPNTIIARDGANPTSPVLSGTPIFNGGVAVLFSEDQFGVGFDAGFFNAVGSTAITAFARDGSFIGSVANTKEGIEFLGLATDNGQASIAGVFLDLISDEPGGFAIDNIRFGTVADVNIPSIPEPASMLLLALGLAGLRFARK